MKMYHMGLPQKQVMLQRTTREAFSERHSATDRTCRNSNFAKALAGKGSCMGPEYGGPLPPPLKGSEVWALGLYRVYKGNMRGPL